MAVIGESQLLRALTRLSIMEELEDCLPAHKRELKRLKKRRDSRRRSSCAAQDESFSGPSDTSVDSSPSRTSRGVSLSPLRDSLASSSDGVDDSEFGPAEPLVEGEDDVIDEEEDEEMRRLAEEIRMLEEETARLALEADEDEDEEEENEEDHDVEAEAVELGPQEYEDLGAETSEVDSAAAPETEPELAIQEVANSEYDGELTEDETVDEVVGEDEEGDEEHQGKEVVSESSSGEAAGHGEASEFDETHLREEIVSALDDPVEAEGNASEGEEEGKIDHANSDEAMQTKYSDEQPDGEVGEEEAIPSEAEEVAAEEDDGAVEKQEEEDARKRKHAKKEKGVERDTRVRRRAHKQEKEQEDESDEEEDKPVVRRRLKKLAEVRAKREAKKIAMFSDDSEDDEEDEPKEIKKRVDKDEQPSANKKTKGGMMEKLRMLAKQTMREASEDEAEQIERESSDTDREDEGEGEPEELVDRSDGKPSRKPAIKEEKVQQKSVREEQAQTNDVSESEEDAPVEEEDTPEPPAPDARDSPLESEESEEDDDEQGEGGATASWKRLRKYVEDTPKGKRTAVATKKSDTHDSRGGKKKKAVESKERGQAKKKKNDENEGVDDEFVEEEVERVQLWKGLSIPAKMWDGLYPYQKSGVEFMWSLFVKKTGGILGDEMGLGKTIQALVLILGALTSGRAKRVLVVTPLSVMKNWENELMKWSDNGAMLENQGMGICIMHGAMNKKKNEIKDKAPNRIPSVGRNLAVMLTPSILSRVYGDQVFYHEGGLCFTTYGSVPTKLQSFVSINWDIVLLDEGHKIKNHRITLSQAMRRIPSTTRILLTGTPIQNNLMELWSLFDYTCKGQLLGTIHEFGRQFEQPIRRATYKCASAEEKQLAYELSKQMRHILAPHFLRREKKDVFNTNGDAAKTEKQEGGGHPSEATAAEDRQQQALTTRMNDLIVWLSLSQMQERLYHSFLASDQVKHVLATKTHVLEGLQLLKKLCDHPRLLTAKNAKAVDAELLASCGLLHNNPVDLGDEEEIESKPKGKQAKRNEESDADSAAESESDSDDEEVDHRPVTRQATQAKQRANAKFDIGTGMKSNKGRRVLAAGEFNTRLPYDIKLRIFKLVGGPSTGGAQEVAKLMMVCSDWKRVASDDALWFPLCLHHSFVDARGRDRQAKALVDAEKREAERARQEAQEARRMAYGIHPPTEDQEDQEEKEDTRMQEGDDVEPNDGGEGMENAEDAGWESGEVPAAPKEATWRECFVRKRKENLLGISAKLVFLMRLLPKLREEGSRVLIFSQSLKMLNIIELLLKEGHFSFLRIDGSIFKSDERQRRVELFNSDPSYFCFLLTTVVGGIGLNLTGADRVVIIDPSWNPTHDNQAVCRAYRLGQKKNVVVYRLITCGTIEEKIYRRQVFKGAIVQSTMTQKTSTSYFSREELADLFHLGDSRASQTQKDLHALHARERVTDKYTDQHIEYLHKIGVHGISDHNLLFSKTQAVESSAAAKQQAKMAVRHLKNQDSDDEDAAEAKAKESGRRRKKEVERQQDEGEDDTDDNAEKPEKTSEGRKKNGKAKETVAPPAARRRPRESLADTSLSAFTPPVTVYSRVIEKTRLRKLGSPAASNLLATPQRKGGKLATTNASSSSLLSSATKKNVSASATKKRQEEKENVMPRSNAKRLAFDD